MSERRESNDQNNQKDRSTNPHHDKEKARCRLHPRFAGYRTAGEFPFSTNQLLQRVYGAKVWHSNSKYRRIIYRCNHKYHDGKTCSTPNLTEDEIKSSFVAAVNKLIANKGEVIANLEAMSQTLFGTEVLECAREKLSAEMDLLQNMIQAAIAENAHIALDQAAYQKRFDKMREKYEDAKRQHDDIKQQIADKTSARVAASRFIGTLKKMDGLITEFDPSLWSRLLDHVAVYSKEDMQYTFKDGTEIKL